MTLKRSGGGRQCLAVQALFYGHYNNPWASVLIDRPVSPHLSAETWKMGSCATGVARKGRQQP